MKVTFYFKIKNEIFKRECMVANLVEAIKKDHRLRRMSNTYMTCIIG